MTVPAFSKHLMEAPEDDEALSEEGKRFLDEGYEDLDAGRTHTLKEVSGHLTSRVDDVRAYVRHAHAVIAWNTAVRCVGRRLRPFGSTPRVLGMLGCRDDCGGSHREVHRRDKLS